MRDSEVGMINDCIDNLELQIRWIEEIDAHKFPGWKMTVGTMQQAIRVLKAQEPLKPETIVTTGAGISMARCPKCGIRINENHNPNYCGDCGQAVKWE